jgi:hypothetical protein
MPPGLADVDVTSWVLLDLDEPGSRSAASPNLLGVQRDGSIEALGTPGNFFSASLTMRTDAASSSFGAFARKLSPERLM